MFIIKNYFSIMIETWKPIKKFEKNYIISNHGNIKNLKNNKSKTFTHDKDGYLKTCLWKNNIPFYFRVSRLVAIHFIPNPKKLPIVNHKDRVKDNNYYKNLEWGTQKYNIEHFYNNPGPTPDRTYNKNDHSFKPKLNYQIAEKIRSDYFKIKSQRRLARKYNVSKPTIARILKKDRYPEKKPEQLKLF